MPRSAFQREEPAPSFSPNFLIAATTAANPAEASPWAAMGVRTCCTMVPLASTSPAAILVPPMSTPIARLSFLSVMLGLYDLKICGAGALARDGTGKVALPLRVPLAIGLRPAQCEKQNVQIAQRRHDQGIVQSLPPQSATVGSGVDQVPHLAYKPGNGCPAHNGHDHDSRAVPGQWT